MATVPWQRWVQATATCALAAAVTAGCATGRPRQQPAPQPAVPANLTAFDTDATALIDSSAAKDWTRVSTELASLHQGWTTLRPALAAKGARPGLLDATEAALSEVDHEANGLSAQGTAAAANRLTAFVPDLLALYNPAVPPQIPEMQFLARTVAADATGGETVAVWTDSRTLATQWDFIRPATQRADGPDATALDGQLADLDAAVTRLTDGGGGPAVPAQGGTSSAVMPSSSTSGVTSLPSLVNPSSASSSTSAASAEPPASSPAGTSTPSRASAPAGSPRAVAGAAGGTSGGAAQAVVTAAAQISETLGAISQHLSAAGT